MFPERLLAYSLRSGEVVPRFLEAADQVWLQRLLDDVERFAERPERELLRHLRQGTPEGAPLSKLRMAVHVLERLWSVRTQVAIPAREARGAVFGAAAGRPGEREDVLRAVAASFHIEPTLLEQSLFADLPGERRLSVQAAALSTVELAVRVNLSLAQGLLYRAQRIHVEIEGDAAPIVRLAKQRRLICTAKVRPPLPLVLDISGPFTLFRHTRLYGRALGELLRLLGYTARFRLLAWCSLRGRMLPLTLQSGDPVFPPHEPPRAARRVDERLARDFAKLETDWKIVLAPEPIEVGEETLFPEVALEHRDGRRWLLDIAGFWTPASIHYRLAELRRAGLTNVLCCVDDDLNCGEVPLQEAAGVLRFRRRIEPADLLAVIDATLHSSGA